MKILLDTSYIVWIFSKAKNITPRIVSEFETADIYFSSVSLQEIAIKRSIGKAFIPKTSMQVYETALEYDWKYLSFEPEDSLCFEKLPVLHGDPFDRMIIAQALRHSLTIATTDRQFEKYSVKVLS